MNDDAPFNHANARDQIIMAILIERYGDPCEGGKQLSITDEQILRLDGSRVITAYRNHLTRTCVYRLSGTVVDVEALDDIEPIALGPATP